MKSIFSFNACQSVRQAIKVTLGPAAYEVVQAEDGVDDLLKVKPKAMNMVVTDLNRPRMDGMTCIQPLRQLFGRNGAPIVFLTTQSDAGVGQQAKSADATGWILKPFIHDQGLDIMKTLIGYGRIMSLSCLR